MMNADDFYDEFKNGLQALGLEWGQKHMATVYVQDNYFWMSFGPRSIRLDLPA